MARDSGPGSKTPDVVMTKWRLDDCRRSLLGWHGAPDLQIEAAVQAPQKIGQRLAHVAKDYFHAREALEQAAEDEAQRMPAIIRRPRPDRTVQLRPSGEQLGMIGQF